MCTVLLLLRPDARWPLLIAANRDERVDRAFEPPARYWPELAGVVAPRDVLGGGTWFGLNDDGVVATIVNGMDRLGPLAGKATRGGLVLRALAAHDAESAAAAVADEDASGYRGFTFIVADRQRAYSLSSDERTIQVTALAPGHHLVTPDGTDVAWSPRYAAHFEAFRAAPPPDPESGRWEGWTELLRHADENDPHRAMTVVTGDAFGTVSSTLCAIPAAGTAPVLLFAAGPPTRTAYRRVELTRTHAASAKE